MQKTIGLAGITAVVLLGLASAGVAQDSPSTAQQEERMGEILRAYLLKHPEIIDEAMQAQRERQAAEAAAKTAQALKEHRNELLADPMSPVVGNPDGKVTVVEFFDYNCPYCRAAGPMVTELLQGNPDVRFVYINGGVLHVGAHTVNIDASLARDLDNGVLSQPARGLHQPVVEHRIEFRALTAGGERRLRREAGRRGEGWELLKSIDGNIELARAIGVTGSPTFIIGDAMLVGAKPLQQIESAIADARPPSARRPPPSPPSAPTPAR